VLGLSGLMTEPERDVSFQRQPRCVLKGHQMEKAETVIAVFADHNSAEAAVKKLTAAGFEMGDRIKFWGTRGAIKK
jgi:hypothetical protein